MKKLTWIFIIVFIGILISNYITDFIQFTLISILGAGIILKIITSAISAAIVTCLIDLALYFYSKHSR
jgi:hypothetical protein